MPVSDVIDARSRGCLIKAVQLQLCKLDVNWTPRLRARRSVPLKWALFCCFPPTFRLTENILEILSPKESFVMEAII